MLWKTRDGSVLDIKDMSDKHLLFSHRLINERYNDINSNISAAWSISGIINGDMAQYYIDRDIEIMEDLSFSCRTTMTNLEKEMRLRGLTPYPARNGKEM
jgi:hypothetical protein